MDNPWEERRWFWIRYFRVYLDGSGVLVLKDPRFKGKIKCWSPLIASRGGFCEIAYSKLYPVHVPASTGIYLNE